MTDKCPNCSLGGLPMFEDNGVCPMCGEPIKLEMVDITPSIVGWTLWSKENLAKEIRDRLKYFYGQTDGSMKFPNTVDGDIHKMVHALISKL